MSTRITSRQSRRNAVKKEGSHRSSSKFEEGLPLTNKKQILGFFLALLGFLIIISIVSYSSNDQSRLESFSAGDIFKKENQSINYNTSNWLGIVGVVISGFFVNGAFGYFSAVMPLIIFLAGVQMVRKKNLMSLVQFSVYSMLLMMVLAASAGVMKLTLGADKIPFAMVGISGEYFSSITSLLLGTFGSYLVLFALTVALGFLIADRDIARTLARLKLMWQNMREKYAESIEEMRERKEERRQKEISRDAIRKEREKILLTKNGRHKEENIEEALIRDTKINRPVENELVHNFTGTRGVEEKPEVKKEIELDEEFENAEPVLFEKISAKGKPVLVQDGISQEDSGDTVYPAETLEDYQLPSLELLDEPSKEELDVISDEELKENGKLLQAKLLNFGVRIDKVIATPGPVVTLYELVPAEDVKLSRIESLEDDIALAMKARGIRMIIPMPGKGTVGVEIPNHNPSMVKIRSVVGSKRFNDSACQLPIALGKTISGEVYVDDLAKMPHILVAGSTGSGKSVGINTIIASLLYKLHPTDLKFLLIDPKKIELNLYEKLKNHYLAVSKDCNEKILTTPQNSVLALKSLEIEMEKRYERLANATVRNIYDYNKKFAGGRLKDDSAKSGESGESAIRHGKMPYIIVIIDELADLMITAAREVEEPIARLAQLARAVGIHLVLATQRPSVDVITGVIKANFPARIAYLVNSKVDSRTILDMNGAEALLGNGDMLYMPPGVGKPIRIQSPFISAEEVEKLADFIGGQKGFSRMYELPSVNTKKKKSLYESDERDELFEEAGRIIVRYQQGSVSLLQRKLKIGYARAARIVDELESANVVGPFDGSKAREVLVESEAQLEQLF
ncbi:MAG TPA: DNA translocase FtsK [Ignavibacteria bacterium]